MSCCRNDVRRHRWQKQAAEPVVLPFASGYQKVTACGATASTGSTLAAVAASDAGLTERLFQRVSGFRE
jgi:hypothetical protein